MNNKDGEKVDYEDELRELLLLQLKHYGSDALKEIGFMNQVLAMHERTIFQHPPTKHKFASV